ncbi:BPSS1187 family protein [Flavobacterium algicola]|uniref:BPSS1187 family protein n=1 Tax=Flavobacterium algicola TaxID=556529 RepID=UPI001EFD6533|nr:hypothetical protein [Flavobacterium algicola]MCG9793001.1 hypothetical protein [Flavobacterium algicola]
MRQYLIALIFSTAVFTTSNAQNAVPQLKPNSILKIQPSKTDSRIKEADTPHLILYNQEMNQGNLLVFLPGTGGIAEKGPEELFYLAVQQGYHVINLSYINTPAIAQICNGKELTDNSNCAEDFRMNRIYGTTPFDAVTDKPHDAIVNRLTKLLTYLVKNDKGGNWDKYLINNSPNWEQIAVAGQSQGGGMAAFIAKDHKVARVIDFSGGWDFSAKGKIATWYFKKSVTSPTLYYGTYHAQEPQARTILESYKAMNIPSTQIYALDLEVPDGKKAHSDGVRNTQYLSIWKELLGNGN